MTSQEIQQSPRAKPRFFYGYVVVLISLFMLVVAAGVRASFGIFFNPLLIEFGWTRAMTSGAFSLAMIVQGLLSIVAGALSDRFGPRLVMTICGFTLGIGYLLMSQTSDLWQLYLFYGVIIGSGMSGFFVTVLSTVPRWFSNRRSLMTGIATSGAGIGILIVPPVANWLILIYDWRLSYIILSVVIILTIVSAAQFLRRAPNQVRQIPYGERSSEEYQSSTENGDFSISRALRTQQFWFTLFIFLCFAVPVFAIMIHIAPHAIDLGISAASAANILAIIGGMSIVGRIALGAAADRIGNRAALIISFSLMSATLFWLTLVTQEWMFYMFAVFFGFAYGGFISAAGPLVAELFGLRSLGLIFGLTDNGFTIGAAVGPLLVGYIFDVTGSYQFAFLLSAVIPIVGLALIAMLKPPHSQKP